MSNDLNNFSTFMEAVDYNHTSSEGFHWECYGEQGLMYYDVRTALGTPVSAIVSLRSDTVFEINSYEGRVLYVDQAHVAAFMKEHDDRKLSRPAINISSFEEAIEWLKNN